MLNQTIHQFKTLIYLKNDSKLLRKVQNLNIENKMKSEVEKLIFNFRNIKLIATSKGDLNFSVFSLTLLKNIISINYNKGDSHNTSRKLFYTAI